MNMNKPCPKNHAVIRRIKSLTELVAILESNDSIFVEAWNKVHPTAVLMNWSIRDLKKWTYRGEFWIVKKKKEIQKERIKKVLKTNNIDYFLTVGQF